MGGSCCTQRDDKEECGRPTVPPRSSPRSSHLAEGPCGRFAVANEGNIEEFYDLQEQVGEGGFGSVRRGVKKDIKAPRAIKTISKGKHKAKELEMVKKEVAVTGSLDHPHIIRLYETFEDRYHYHLVMEVCSGGDLFDYIVEAGHFTEAQAAHVMEQMMKGINYMHACCICHRDMKAENILCLSKDPIEDNTIKLIDFGMAIYFTKESKLRTRAGTPMYMAPEVLKGSYNQLCDVWSCGVILYILLSGAPPFHGDCDAQIFRRVNRCQYKFPPDVWKFISQDAQDLIKMMLQTVENRPTAETVLANRWISLKAPKAQGTALQGGFIKNLTQFRAANKFKKAALQIIANQLADTNANSLREVFESLDDNGDGLLTLVELKSGLETAGITEIPANLQEIMASIDSDGSGVIDYTEFLSAALTRDQYGKDDALWAAFKTFDRDGDGKISKAELERVLSRHTETTHQINIASGRRASLDRGLSAREILKDCDKDGDGEIDFEEFKSMMCEIPDGQ